MIYPNIPSALQLVSRQEKLPVLFYLQNSVLLVLNNEDEAQPNTPPEDASSTYIPSTKLDFKAPHLREEKELSNLVKNLDSHKQGAELLTSR